MRKTLFGILIAASCVQVASAQGGERAVMKGQNSVNVYYGANLLRSFYKNVADEAALNLEIGGLGPIGIVYEHMVTDGIGLGVELGYGQTTVGWDYEDVDFFTGGVLNTYHVDYKFTLIRAQVRANFHFAKSSNFDAYFLLNAGYRHQTFTIETNDPYWTGGSIGTLIPFGIKPGLGLRYFFNGPIGLHMEIAAGTPLLCGGVSVRF